MYNVTVSILALPIQSIIVFFSDVEFLYRYGEIMNIELARDYETGKSKGFAFVQYEDQRSTVLAVDNLNGSKVSGLKND